MAKNYLDKDGLLYLWTLLKNKFVAQDGDKVLSDNNFSDTYKNKLDGIEEGANNYTLPTASAETLGGIKVGAGLAISDGVLSATGGGTADSVDWSNVQNKPTTISGYGITDANISGQTVTLGSNSVTVPTNNNELTNGAGYQTASDVSSAITSATSNLVTTSAMTSAISSATSDMATQTYVTEQIANINKKQVVTSTSEMTDSNTIYLIANSGSGNNVYDEYIVVNGTPEKIGTTEVDLSNYLQETDLEAITNAEIEEILAS